MKNILYLITFVGSLQAMVFDLDDPKMGEELEEMDRIISILEKSLDEFKDIKEQAVAETKFHEIIIQYNYMNDSDLWKTLPTPPLEKGEEK